MATQQAENCGQCAYVRRSGDKMWCPFHDEPVSERLVCDDILPEFQAPLYESLTDEKPKVSPGVIVKDVIAYLMIAGIILLGTVCTYGYLTQ